MKLGNIIFILGAIILLQSCYFHIEPRRYRKGFHISKNRINKNTLGTTPRDTVYKIIEEVPDNILRNFSTQNELPVEDSLIIPTDLNNILEIHESKYKQNKIEEINLPKNNPTEYNDSLDEKSIVKPKVRTKGMKIFFTVLAIIGGLVILFGVFVLAAGIGFSSGIPGIALYILLGGMAIVTFLTSIIIFNIWKKSIYSDKENKKRKILVGLISVCIAILTILLWLWIII